MQVAQLEPSSLPDHTGTGVPAIQLDQVTRRFGAVEALRGISCEVRQGEIFGLLGPNGAGKSTLIRTILSLIRPSSGSVRILGIDVAREPKRVRGLVGWVPQRTANDPMLTARENLVLMAGMHHLRPKAAAQRIGELLELVELTDAADRVVQNYSGGMRKRLDLAMGLIQRPRILLLDEPTLGLDIQTRHRLWNYIESFRTMGTTILLTTHYLEEADALCDRIAIVDGGLIKALDTPERLKVRFGNDSLRLEMGGETGEAELEQLLTKLAKLPGVSDVRRVPGGVTLGVEDHVQLLRPVLDIADQLSVRLTAVMPNRASMDDVFLGLTGYSLRESSEEKEPETR